MIDPFAEDTDEPPVNTKSIVVQVKKPSGKGKEKAAPKEKRAKKRLPKTPPPPPPVTSEQGSESEDEEKSDVDMKPPPRTEAKQARRRPQAGEVNNPACLRCSRVNSTCHQQVSGRGACYECSRKKMACNLKAERKPRRGRVTKRRQPTAPKPAYVEVSSPNESEDESEGEQGEKPQREPRSPAIYRGELLYITFKCYTNVICDRSH